MVTESMCTKEEKGKNRLPGFPSSPFTPSRVHLGHRSGLPVQKSDLVRSQKSTPQPLSDVGGTSLREAPPKPVSNHECPGASSYS